jgi:hypothetical protein
VRNGVEGAGAEGQLGGSGQQEGAAPVYTPLPGAVEGPAQAGVQHVGQDRPAARPFGQIECRPAQAGADIEQADARGKAEAIGQELSLGDGGVAANVGVRAEDFTLDGSEDIATGARVSVGETVGGGLPTSWGAPCAHDWL